MPLVLPGDAKIVISQQANFVLSSANVWCPKGTQAEFHGDSFIVVVIHAVSINALRGALCAAVAPNACLEFFKNSSSIVVSVFFITQFSG